MSMLSVIVPTLNESDCIGETIEKIFAAVPADQVWEVIVVDDGSTDGTLEKVRALAERLPVCLIERGRRMGLSSAVRDGAAVASSEWVAVIDADGSHPPEVLPSLFTEALTHGGDIVIGSRHVSGGAISSAWPWYRRLLSASGTLSSRVLSGVRDPMSGFFVCRRSWVTTYGIRAEGYKILFEIVAQAPASARVLEIPIVFTDRHAGASKMTLTVQVQFFRQLLRLFASRIRSGLADHDSLALMAVLCFDLVLGLIFAGQGVIPPVQALWLGNGLLFLVGTYLLMRRRNLFAVGEETRIGDRLVLFWLLLVIKIALQVALYHYIAWLLPGPPIVVLILSWFLSAAVFIKGYVMLDMLSWLRQRERSDEILVIVGGAFLLGMVYALKFLYLPLPDLVSQEALHWNRALHLAPAYVDHPGGVALAIRIAESVFGTTEFSVRLPAFLSGIMSAWFIYRTGVLLTKRPATGIAAAVLFSLCPFFWGSGFFTFPDSLLILAWTACVYSIVRAIDEGRDRHWLLGGFWFGVGMMSKYTMIVLAGSVFLHLFFGNRGIRRIVSRELVLFTLMAVVVMSPLLIYEMGHAWSTFDFQFVERIDAHQWGFPTFLGSMMGELSPIFAVYLLLVLAMNVSGWWSRDPRFRWLLLAGMPLILLFFVYSQWNRVKFSWPAPAFLSLLPLLVVFIEEFPERMRGFRRVSLLSLVLFFILIQMLFPLLLSFPFDTVIVSQLRDVVTWRSIGSDCGQLRERNRGSDGRTPFIIGLDRYAVASQTTFYGTIPAAEIVSRNAVGRDGLTWNVWSDLTSLQGRNAILVAAREKSIRTVDLLDYFRELSPPATFEVVSGVQRRRLWYRIGYDYRPPHLLRNDSDPY